MSLEDYKKWREGWIEGLYLAGTIMSGYLNLKDSELRKGIKDAIKLLQEHKKKIQEEMEQ